MAHNHDHHFIPSPFKVVTAYEEAFIKEFNESVAEATAEVLKYVAKLTAETIKNEKQ